MFVEPGVFYRFDPVQLPVPIVVDVSRSGREYPIDMRSPVPFTAIHDNVSAYVEDIWGDAPRYGGTMLYARFPHMYIDANRHELDTSKNLPPPEIGQGLTPPEPGFFEVSSWTSTRNWSRASGRFHCSRPSPSGGSGC